MALIEIKTFLYILLKNNFGATKEILSVFERQVLQVESNLATKFDLYRRSINIKRESSLCCHSNNFFMATKNSTSPISLCAFIS